MQVKRMVRRPCAKEVCTYCKVKVKEGISEEKFVGRIIFEEIESEY